MMKRLATIGALFYALAAAAQVTQPILQPHATFVDAAGDPCAGCLLYSYAAGTTTALATYTDSTGVTQNTNPVVLDAAGGAQIWLSGSAYKFILKGADSTLIWTVDNVLSLGDLPYLPISGGTLTGGIVGTTAAFTTLTGQQTNAVYYPTTFSQLQADITACGTNNCTIGVNSTIAVTANTSIPATVTVAFAGGALQPSTGVTLTISGPIQASPVKIFGGAGAVALGSLVKTAPVQWWGAVADSDHLGSTGTNDTTAIQACLDNVARGTTCFFSAGNYKITAPLLINRSQVSIRGVSSPPTSTAWPAASPSRIVTTSATADIIDVWGTNTSTNAIVDNFIQDITLSRGVIPSAGGSPASNCAGISEKFTYEAVVQNVSIEDSANGIYFHGVGASAKGYFENIDVVWGLNGPVETTGTLVGYYVDTLDGTFSPSLRLRNLDAQAPGISTSHPGLEIVGISSEGKQNSDLHVYHFEGFLIDYGIVINGLGMTGFAQATDIFLENCILDSMLVTGVLVEGIHGFGTVNITDGWIFIDGASIHPAIDMEVSSNVHVSNEVIYSPSLAAPVIYALQGGNEQITNNEIIGGPAGAITMDTSLTNVISGNVIAGLNNYGTNVISLINGSSFSTVTGNTINGTATNGIFIDGATHGTQGIETNTIGQPSLGTITNQVNASSGNSLGTSTGLVVGTGGTVVNTVLTGAATLTFTAIGANSSQSQTFTINGALVANTGVFCSPQAALGSTYGLIMPNPGAVFSANTVTVTLSNITAAPITPNAVTWGCTVFQ